MSSEIDGLRDTIDRLETSIDAIGMAGKKRGERIEELERENQYLRKKIAELERVINPDPESDDFSELSRDEKVYQLRQKLVTLAESNGGTYRMKYRDVKNFFDGHPSPGHTYDLMELAGQQEGFGYDDKTGEKRVTVDLADVNDDAFVRGANKTPQEQPA